MNQITDTASLALLSGLAGFDPMEERLRANVRATIEAVFTEELAGFLGRLRYGRGDGPAKGYRHPTGMAECGEGMSGTVLFYTSRLKNHTDASNEGFMTTRIGMAD